MDALEEISPTERIEILKTPIRSPIVNAFAEHLIGSVRRQLLDLTIIWPRLEHIVTGPIDHCSTHRPDAMDTNEYPSDA